MKNLVLVLGVAALLILSTADVNAQTIPDPNVGVLKGDVNLDDTVDFSDIFAFITVLQSGVYQAEADLDCNEVVDFFDIPVFFEGFLPAA